MKRISIYKNRWFLPMKGEGDFNSIEVGRGNFLIAKRVFIIAVYLNTLLVI
ncbi:hypothetical protein J1N09_12095 [Aureitalea sp. L0-47]|uniref:hypothetical protein n=1 Tax=Aureitalea sp. L0-47 TaxID=2816962 RepID=UPI002238E1AA|nr:hypothetical protein [Aureitalea sp. L0-47]MCW5520587.1 hypothetical protein [Aureitalea sp. L0-47]